MRYAVVFNGETELSDEFEGLEEPGGDVNALKLKRIIVKALKQEPSLPLDIQTLSFETGKLIIVFTFLIKYYVSAQNRILNLYKCLSFSVTTVYSYAELGINHADDTTQRPTEDNTSTQSFLPTVAVIENSLEASTFKAETHTFVPFIPNILPEATPVVTDETPLMAGVEEESTEGTAEEPGDIITPDTNLETITEQVEEAEPEPEVEEMPPTEPDDGGEAEPKEVTLQIVFEPGC